MTATHTGDSGLTWLLDGLVDQTPETRHALVLSEDGLLLGCSSSLPREDAEQLSAIASGLQSLAQGTSRHFSGGPVRQTMIEMADLFLFVTAAGSGARLAVLASSAVDVGSIAYEMNMLVRQVGSFLTAAPRFPRVQGATAAPVGEPG
ncbi:roadblock/LC7 domain-containing protein [Streptomyces sp. DSM 44917]|uniref:Roadblock/LC7 domain-containing protein n=1 Tax=Streptomyces boetiae TaxID=3075541 RepID=A0ABU2L3E2_9ACTN|nr:roadblock/LC7 domain-containing protein [Streptomyces sp. DSM 44917]MDT0306078.1 roadblock/LC7 domain-containing protein [Streptomyces sp. DSM 44917]